MMSSPENQEYVSQLQAVFDSCDTSHTGLLLRPQLVVLCEKLQFQGQSQVLIDILLGGEPNAGVDFVHFKDAFIAVLSETMDSDEEEEDDDDEDDDEYDDEEDDEDEEQEEDGAEMSPKLVKGDKRYGRRSHPGTDTEGDMSDTDYTMGGPSPHHTPRTRQELKLRLSDLEDNDMEYGYEESPGVSPLNKYATSSPKSSAKISPKLSPKISPKTSPKMSPTGSPGARTSHKQQRKTSETFEAEGQMEQSIAEAEPSSEDHRRNMHLVWQELGVGREGYLTLEELASVCERIGMEEMNGEELRHLFEKLDVDADGRVSFDEFLQGLFQYGGPNSTPTPTRQLSSTPRQKLRMSMTGQLDDSRQTPSLVSAGSGLFSALDDNNTGYAKVDDIIELWDSFGIPQGAEILEYLEFNLVSKVNLMDLSMALEQELRSVEEDNATYQAAIATYEYELRFLKVDTEHLMGERDKLKIDLADAHSRITLLVKEGDERYSLLEHSKDREINDMEKKYQEQIKLLQSQLDRERDMFYNQSDTQTQKLESELGVFKDEEYKLKDRVLIMSKECEKLEKENLDMAEKYADLEQQKQRQERELEATAELQRKLAEMEEGHDDFLDEHHKSSEEKLLRLQSENMELKDQADEMTVEIQELRQQVLVHNKQKRNLHSPQKLNNSQTYSPDGTGDEASDEDVSYTRTRRRLRRASDEVTLHAEKLQDEVAQLKTERESLLTHHEEEIKSLQENYDSEIRSLEQTHDRKLNSVITINQEQLKTQENEFDDKMRILLMDSDKKLKLLEQNHSKSSTSAQSDHLKRIGSLDHDYHDQLDKLKSDNLHLEESLAEKDRRLNDLVREHADDLAMLQSKHEEELSRIKEEYDERIKIVTGNHDEVLDSLQNEHDDEVRGLQQKLDGMTSETSTKTEEVHALHRGFSLERRDIEDAYKMEIAELEDRHMQEKNNLVKTMKKDQEEMETEYAVKLNEKLVEKEESHKQELEHEKANWLIRTESEKNLLRHEFDKEKERISEEHKIDLTRQEVELNKKTEERMSSNRTQFEELQRQKAESDLQMRLQKEELQLQFKKDRMEMMEKFDEEKAKLLDRHRSVVLDYENIFVQGMDALKGQLRTDFYNLLDDHKHQQQTKLESKFDDDVQKEKLRLEREMDRERTQLTREFDLEKKDLEREINREKDSLLMSSDLDKKNWEREAQLEQKRLVDELTREKTRLEKEWKAERERINKDHERALKGKQQEFDNVQRQVSQIDHDKTRAINEKRALELDQSSRDLEREVFQKEQQDARQQETHSKLEEEFLQQINLLKYTFADERDELESKIRQLQAQLRDQVNDDNLGTDLKLREAQQQLRVMKETEARYQKQVEEMSRTNSQLREERNRVEAEKTTQRKDLEDKIHALVMEREQIVTAGHVKALQSARQPASDIDKAAILREIDSQKRLLVEKTGDLERQIQHLDRSKAQSVPLQLAHERLIEDKLILERALEDKENKLKNLLDQSLAAEQFKARASNREAEIDALRQQLQMTTDRLTDASTALSIAKSEHQRELGALRQKINNMADISKYNDLQKQLAGADAKMGQLQAALEKRAAETTKVIMGTQADHKRAVERLEEDKEETERRASQLQQLLDEQVERLKHQLSKSSKTDILAKDLYVENAHLMKALQLTEKREKDAEKKVYNLEDKCKGFIRLIRKLTPLAMS